MLSLTRKTGESIHVGDRICITVQGVRGNRVQLGIEAPRDVNVRRYETYAAAIAQHNKENGFTTDPPTND